MEKPTMSDSDGDLMQDLIANQARLLTTLGVVEAQKRELDRELARTRATLLTVSCERDELLKSKSRSADTAAQTQR